MAFSGNNQRMFPKNPFSGNGNTPFAPQQAPGPGLAGMLAPQTGQGPYATDAFGPDGAGFPYGNPPPKPTNAQDLKNQYGSSPQELAGYGGNPILPYVAPSTTGIIEQMLGLQAGYAGTALPLLEQLLGAENSTYDTYQQFFGPEMALRNQIVQMLGGQNNDALSALLGLMDQVQPQKSSTSYFAGFS